MAANIVHSTKYNLGSVWCKGAVTHAIVDSHYRPLKFVVKSVVSFDSTPQIVIIILHGGRKCSCAI